MADLVKTRIAQSEKSDPDSLWKYVVERSKKLGFEVYQNQIAMF